MGSISPPPSPKGLASDEVLYEHPTIKTIQCRGSPHHIGVIHGRHASQEILNNIETYTFFFRETAGLSWSEARSKAASIFIPVLRQQFPQILEELSGIALGAGRGLVMEDILLLNTRSEIALTCYADGCTSLAQPGPQGEMYLCQNWDWLEELHRGIVFLHIFPEEGSGHAVKMISEAGIVGKIGSNSAGLGVCMNAIRSGAFNRGGFPVHILNRWLLQHCRSVSEATSAIDRFGTGCTANYLLADREGQFVDIESSPYGNASIEATEARRVVAHTNHLCAPGKPAKLKDHPAENSFRRLDRIYELTEQHRAEGVVPCFEILRQRLSDEQGYPYSICRDRPPGAVGMEKMTTLATVLMDLKAGLTEITVGRPCLDLPKVRWSWAEKNTTL
jgi:isopenicillin-N N-acyltransferase-like protein